MAVTIISSAKTAYFRLTKSILEEPWVRHIGQRFQQCGYSVRFTPSSTLIYMDTQVSVDLFYIYWQWYGGNDKRPLSCKNLSPETLLHWHIDDGTTSEGKIVLYTQSFSFSDNEFLLSRLNHIGIEGTVGKTKDSRTSKIYYLLRTKRAHTQKFFSYLKRAPKKSLCLAKSLFPWKFDCGLRKKDVIRDENYILTFLDLLAHSGVKISSRSKELSCIFPWNIILWHSSL